MISHSFSILLMEDDRGLARLCQKKLEGTGHAVTICYDGEAGLAAFNAGQYDLVILDQVMPECDGLEVIRRLSTMGSLPPIIMATGEGNEQLAVEAMRLGARDYLIKDVNGGYLDLLPTVIKQAIHQQEIEESVRLSAKVFESATEGILITDAAHRIISVNEAFTVITGFTADEVVGKSPCLWQSQQCDDEFYQRLWASVQESGKWEGEVWNRHQNGQVYPAWLAVSAVKDERGLVTNYIGFLVDITTRKQAEAHLYYLATHDQLTGLSNRSLFYEQLTSALKHARRKGQQIAVILFDLDHFKPINDALGHAAGDAMLQCTAKRLIENMRDCDIIGRLGGDEFTVFLTEFAELHEVAEVAQRILDVIAQPFILDDQLCQVTASIGISLYPTHGSDPETLMKSADSAMYRAKQRHNCFEFALTEDR